jgi:hypothetical protein
VGAQVRQRMADVAAVDAKIRRPYCWRPALAASSQLLDFTTATPSP